MYYVFVMALATVFSFLVCSTSTLVKAQDIRENISYKQATVEDLPGLLELINAQAITDSDKIVILPKLFREQALKSSIEKSRFFVAVHNGKVIAFKKLFCITDKQELQEILTHELRCNVQSVDQGLILPSGERAYTFVHSMPGDCPEIIERATYIYDGGDYTHPEYRRLGINTRLTDYAFAAIQELVAAHAREHNSQQVIIAYGLTETNAGDSFLAGRTRSIVQCFTRFVGLLAGSSTQENSLSGRRYTAFMPTFDPEGQELRPLPDNRSIPGYGYLLAALLLQHGAQINNGRSA